LLAVQRLFALEVEDVVTDLERRTEVEAELDDRARIDGAPRADDRTHAHRVDRRVPARLVHDQGEVVLRGEVEDVVFSPAELGRLALEGPKRHRVELGVDPIGDATVEGLK